MRTVRNITVAVDPELYRQTRRIAADYDTTVADRVRCPARSSEGHALSRPSKLPVSPREKAKSPCMPVKASKLQSLQPLAAKQLLAVQDKYFSIAPLKTII
jgi:hypothetical protein